MSLLHYFGGGGGGGRFPCPRKEKTGPVTLDLACHYLSLPNQTEKVMRSKAVRFFFFFLSRESQSFKELYVQAICFVLVVI